MKQSDQTITWLHLSDFHFKADRTWQQSVPLKTLSRDVIEKFSDLDLSPDWVFITGDIAHSGKSEEYAQASKYFQELYSNLGHNVEAQWFVVPGNHDVDRQQVTAIYQGMRDMLTEKQSAKLLGRVDSWKTFANRQHNFLQFTKKLLGEKRGWNSATPWEIAVREIHGIKVGILALNSAWACQDEQDQGKILISTYQLQTALDAVNKEKVHLKIALMHHPFDSLQAFDKLQIRNILLGRNGCHFLLHGHLHESDIEGYWNPSGRLLKFTAGISSGENQIPRSAVVVRLNLSQGKGMVYAWTYVAGKGGFWVPDNRLYPSMSEGKWEFELPSSWNFAAGSPTKRSGQEPMVNIPTAYRTTLQNRLGSIDPLVQSEKPLLFRTLEMVVPFSVDWSEPEKTLAKGKTDPLASSPDEIAPARRPATDLITHKKYRHFILVGAPGSGKSTFVHFHTLNELDKKDPRLPLPLQVKDFGDWLQERSPPEDQASTLINWAEDSLKKMGLVDLKRRLGKGRLLWFLDGLDEIFDKKVRERAAKIIGDWFTGEGNKDRLILTSRPHAIQQPGIKKALGLSGTVAFIQPLDREAQKLFLTKWNTALYGGDNEETIQQLGEDLWTALDGHSELSELKSSPLLLSMIATVYHLGKRLPDRRSDLYEQAVWVLLQRRFGPSAGGSDLLVREMRQGLMAVARGMTEKGQIREIGELEFIGLLRKGVYKEEQLTTLQQAELEGRAAELGSHSGLLNVEGAPPRYRFIHLCFQEFLTARSYAQERNAFASLHPHLEDGAWDEVILLTAGYLFENGPAYLGADFITALLEESKSVGSGWRSLTLALRAVAESPPGELAQEITSGLKDLSLKKLGDPDEGGNENDRCNAALALGRFGDSRLGMMKKDRWVPIKKGKFRMGSGQDHKGPEHWVRISNDFLLGKFPVTNQEFNEFIQDEGYREEKWWSTAGWKWRKKELTDAHPRPDEWQNERFNAPNQPVVGISWHEAEAYCLWLTQKMKDKPPEWWKPDWNVRLPTEAEWEYAARGEKGRRYPWGPEKPDETRANY